MEGIYLTDKGRHLIEDKISEIENYSYATQNIWIEGQNSGMLKILEEILESATILPVDNWQNVKDMLDINTLPTSYKEGFVINKK